MSSINTSMKSSAPQGPSTMDELDAMDKANVKQLKPEDFLTMFLAQLKNQNPLSPTDSNTILQQMSSISSISANKYMQKTLKNLQDHIDATLGNSQVLAATQLIGKKVQIPSDKAPLDEKGISGSALVTNAATNVTVTIKDADGNIIKKIDLGAAKSTGLMDFAWDGKDADGKLFKKDYYQISATATVDGVEQPLKTAGSFEVKSVATNPTNGSVILNVDGLGGKYLGDIIKIL